VDGVIVDIAEDDGVEVAGRELVAEIDLNAAVGGHVMPMIDDGWEEFVGVRERGAAGLTDVDAAGSHMEEVINDAGADEGVSVAVEVDAPRVAGAVGEDLEAAGARVPPGDGSVHLNAVIVGVERIANGGVGEDAVSHVQVSVGAPGEAIEEFVTILETEAGHDGLTVVSAVIVGSILEEQEVGGLTDVSTAVAQEQAGGEVEAVGPDVDCVGVAIAVGIFEDLDAIAGCGAWGGAHGIFVEFEDPEAAAIVPIHGDGVGDGGFSGEEPDFESLRELKACLSVEGIEWG
jgi:hypothetical protein